MIKNKDKRNKKIGLLLGLGLLLAAEEAVFGFGSFALRPPAIRAEKAAEAGSDENGEGIPVLLELHIDNRNPFRQMRNVRAELLPGDLQEDADYTGEAVRIDIPGGGEGRYGLALTLGRSRCERLLAGEEEAILRVTWGHALHEDLKLADLLQQSREI
ncbi:hypothetical protein [Saccharibacillus deserti]|uniref:hypothetical protein n=1 Tax=Saccharibacillus deserti TaxID=1634444 RepID=UPI0015569A90|nr:hypothetical protein [Saccharibacillus deserti]